MKGGMTLISAYEVDLDIQLRKGDGVHHIRCKFSPEDRFYTDREILLALADGIIDPAEGYSDRWSEEQSLKKQLRLFEAGLDDAEEYALWKKEMGLS